MISPQQAKETYGFIDATEREDNLTLGLFHACEALFDTPTLLFVERTTPIVISILVLGSIAGTLLAGLSYYVLLLPLALCMIFIPKFHKSWQFLKQKSGMCHIESVLGKHFLMAEGVCTEKSEGHGKFNLPIYTVKVRVAKNTYLEGVLVLKELFDQMETGTRVRVMMADSPAATQMIAAPCNFMEIEVDKKRIGLKDFEVVDPRTVRTLTEAERALYLAQYQKQMQLWRDTYLRNYRLMALVGAVAVVLTYHFRSYNGLGLAGALLLSVPLMYLFTTGEFRGNLRFLQDTTPLTGVETTVTREAGYQPGEPKSAHACVIFKDASGAVLWRSRKVEDLKLFAPKDKAILLIKGKDLLPFHLEKAPAAELEKQ